MTDTLDVSRPMSAPTVAGPAVSKMNVVCRCAHAAITHSRGGCRGCDCALSSDEVLLARVSSLEAALADRDADTARLRTALEEITERASYPIDSRGAFDEALYRVRAAIESADHRRRAQRLRTLAAALPDAFAAMGAQREIHGVTWLLIRDGCVLLEKCPKKARVLGVGEWFVPGGKIEGDETPSTACRREISEEWPSVSVLSLSPLPLLEGSPVPPGPRGLFLMRPYLVEVQGEIAAESSEGIPLRWFPIAEALASPVPQVRMMVAAACAESALSAEREARVAAEPVAWMVVRDCRGHIWSVSADKALQESNVASLKKMASSRAPFSVVPLYEAARMSATGAQRNGQ
jgi:8-oxo-dGTP pyrophosphatase MutT (NUDIX family)